MTSTTQDSRLRTPRGRVPGVNARSRVESRRQRSTHGAASRSTKQNTKTKASSTGQTVRVALRVHPWFGEEVVVIGPRGQSIRGAIPDGRTCDLPLAWTDWRPRAAPLEVNGCRVRLAPEGLVALAGWINARVKRQKLDRTDREDQKRGDGEQGRARAATSAVVGKAGAPRVARSKRKTKGPGKR